MQRFAQFVDGSNLFGSLKSMNLEVSDYEKFFAYVHRETVSYWRSVTQTSEVVPTQLRRIYWYVVGSIDEWDLSLPQAQIALRKSFDADKVVKSAWTSTTGKANASLSGAALAERAWTDCFADFKSWYESKVEILRKMHGFHQAIRSRTDLIDVIESGHWKVHFIGKWVEEKGLDTSLAVDMVANAGNYDVAVIASGDADSIPSVRYLKNQNKHICAVEFVNGSPPEAKGRSFSSRLGEHSDFVVRIYETELVRHGLAHRPAAGPIGAPA